MRNFHAHPRSKATKAKSSLQTMAVNRLWGHIAWQTLPNPAHVLIFSLLVYGIARLVLAFRHIFLAPNTQKASPVTSSLDQAEKGSFKKQEDISEDDLFQLEKRAFFSKVGPLALIMPAPSSGLTKTRHGYMSATAADLTSREITTPLTWPASHFSWSWART